MKRVRNRKIALVLLILLAGALFSPGGAEQRGSDVIAIVGATVVDGTGAPPSQQTVVIRGDRIATVAAKVELPAGARVIHAEGQTLLPGLFDLHTHLPYSATSMGADWPKILNAYLYCGVLSVADFGSYPEMFEPMRRLLATGKVAGPHIALAARVVAPGGHGDEAGRGDFFSLEVSTPREARAAIRKVLPYHPDVIKAFTDGWRYGAAPDLYSMNEATVAALVDEAHKNGLKVLTHTVTLEGDKIAARAGVDVIDHGIGDADADPEVIALLRQKGTTYASTLAVYEQKPRGLPAPWVAAILDPGVQQALAVNRESDDTPARPAAGATGAADSASPSPQAVRWNHLLHNVGALNAAGVAIGVGTDAGETATFHGYATLREMELLVQAGLTPLEAIHSATLVSARALGVDGERGSITPGKLADLVLVNGSPQQNIADIEKTARVFLAGREIDRDALAHDIGSTEMSAIPAVSAAELVDDFEGPADPLGPEYLRSRIGTQWVNTTDAGTDHSRMSFGTTLRQAGDHALSVLGRMSVAERPFIAVSLPLSRGAVEPVDARAYLGIRFDVRGDGPYRLLVPTRAVRNGNYYQATFQGAPQWKTVSIAFASLQPTGPRQPVPWTGADLLALVFRIERRSGELGWLELDNVRFYK